MEKDNIKSKDVAELTVNTKTANKDKLDNDKDFVVTKKQSESDAKKEAETEYERKARILEEKETSDRKTAELKAKREAERKEAEEKAKAKARAEEEERHARELRGLR